MGGYCPAVAASGGGTGLHWTPEVLSVLRTVSALGHVAAKDVAKVLVDVGAVRRAVSEAALVLHDSELRPVNDAVAELAMSTLDDDSRRDLYARLSDLPLSEFVVARLQDLSAPAGVDEDLAEHLESVARRAEQRGDVDVAIDLWLRSVSRTTGSSSHHHDRLIRSAERAIAAGQFDAAHRALDEIDFAVLSLDQSVSAAYALASALSQGQGVEMARFRLEQRRATLAADDPSTLVFDVILAGLHDHHGVALQELESVLPSIGTGHLPARLEHAALSLVTEAKVNVGLGLDRDLLDRMLVLEERLDLRLQDTAGAVEAYLAHQTGDAKRTKQLAPQLLVKSEADGDVGYQEIILVHGAMAEIELGHFDSAGRLLSRVTGATAREPGWPAAVRAEALLALELGDYDRFRVALARPHSSAGREGAGAFTRSGLQGVYLARAGDLTGAAEFLKDCIWMSRRMGIEEPGRRMWAEVELALVSARAGAVATARTLAGQLDRLRARGHRPLLDMQSARVGAWIAHREQDAADVLVHLTEVLAILPTLSWLPERSRALIDVVSLLPPDEVDSKVSNQVRTQAITLLGLLEDGVARRGLTEALRTHELTRLSDLTASELRVIEAVSRGLSNKDAAQALFLSFRTVESHLASIYRKLNVSSRSQLIALMSGRV